MTLPPICEPAISTHGDDDKTHWTADPTAISTRSTRSTRSARSARGTPRVARRYTTHIWVHANQPVPVCIHMQHCYCYIVLNQPKLAVQTGEKEDIYMYPRDSFKHLICTGMRAILFIVCLYALAVVLVDSTNGTSSS